MHADMIISVCPSPKAANTATKAKMVTGLVSARRRAETYDPNNPLLSKGTIGSLRLARNVLIPRNKSNPPPTRRSQNDWLAITSETNVRPNAAMLPYSESAVAAPRPMIRPRECPSASVLRMHIIPSGPIGTAIANPIISPFRKKIGPMLQCSDKLVAVDTVRRCLIHLPNHRTNPLPLSTICMKQQVRTPRRPVRSTPFS